MNNVRAVYEHGKLKPSVPRDLKEGQRVRLSLTVPRFLGPVRPLTPVQVDWERRIKAAKNLEEMFAVVDSAGREEDDGYDLCRALDENRMATGQRLLYPELLMGENSQKMQSFSIRIRTIH